MLHPGHLLGRPKNSLSGGPNSPSVARRHVSPSPVMELFSVDMDVSNTVTLELFVSHPPFTHLGKEGSPPVLCALVGKG